ncbi:MAG: DUF2179 domain-containing protein [Bacillota bacterium]
MDVLLQAMFIFFARILDVSMGTMRMILLVKGNRRIAAFIGFFEVMVFVIVLGKVVSGLSNPIYILAYCTGFACGNFVGSKIEERLSFGRLIAQIIVSDITSGIVEKLRDSGYGVTVFEGEGRDGKRYMLNIILERKKLNELKGIIENFEANAFITTMDIRSSLGGYFQPKKI